MKEIEPLVDITTLRKTYPVSKRTVGRWISKGCPSKLIDGRRLFRLSAVERWTLQFNQGIWIDKE